MCNVHIEWAHIYDVAKVILIVYLLVHVGGYTFTLDPPHKQISVILNSLYLQIAMNIYVN